MLFNLFDRQSSSSVRLLATNVTNVILCLITLHNLRNTSIMININDNTTKSSTVMSLNKTLSTFFPPLQELANWLAVTLTLLRLMFVSIVFYSRLPAAETQIVDHATVKRQLIILGRKTGDDSGRRDGKQWWYMSEYDEDVMGETQDRQICLFAKIKVIIAFILITHLLDSLQARHVNVKCVLYTSNGFRLLFKITPSDIYFK